MDFVQKRLIRESILKIRFESHPIFLIKLLFRIIFENI